MCLKMTREPGKAIAMEISSPSNHYHLSMAMHFWIVGITDRISLKRLSWCGGKDKVMLTVCINHPRRTWQVKHTQSPALVFFSNKTSLRLDKPLQS